MHKIILAFACMTAVVLSAGCTDKSKPGGGDDKDKQFKLAVKDTFKQGQDIKQGDTLL